MKTLAFPMGVCIILNTDSIYSINFGDLNTAESTAIRTTLDNSRAVLVLV